MNKPTDAVDMEIVELKRQMVVSLARIDPALLVGFGHEVDLKSFAPALLVGFGHEVDLKSFADFITEELVAKLTACVWTRETAQVEAFPASWWQQWKQDHAPRWLVERWPIRMRRFEVTFQEIYPKLVMPGADARSIRVSMVRPMDRARFN